MINRFIAKTAPYSAVAFYIFLSVDAKGPVDGMDLVASFFLFGLMRWTFEDERR